MKNESILEFAKIISGVFSNKEQALNNPKNFAHIQIHIRPLFLKTFGCYAFYSEQRYQHDIWNPYRQSINKLRKDNDIFIMSNHSLIDKEKFTSGAINFSLLNDISKYYSHEKSGCSMHFRESSLGTFLGNVEPGRKCYVKIGKQKTYLKSKVILNKKSLTSEDSGYEKETDKKIWGSNFGPLVFKKIDNFDNFIETYWRDF